jgi:hypothetical protein
MSFLAPFWIPLTAAGLAVPSLLLFYFLKLRRQEMAVPSTLLWKQAVQDLQVNSPFQRLRNNLLLWLQMIILLLAIFCLWQPVMRMTQTEEKTAILLIDQSASMATEEADGRTRFEIAKENAKTYIDNLDARSKAMIICFAERARVAAPFTTDKQDLRQQIDRLEPTDCASRIAEALELAEAHSTRQVISGRGGDMTPESTTEPAEMILFSDGRIQDAEGVVLRRGGMLIQRIGEATDNVGIIGLDARRNYERPEELNVFVTIGNFGPQAVTTNVDLTIGRQRMVSSVNLGPAPPDRVGLLASQPSGASAEAADASATNFGSVPFKLTYDDGGILEVKLARDDALPLDNRAWLVIQPPRSLSVLLVSSGNHYFLKRALDSLPLREVKVVEPEVFEGGRKTFAPGGRLAWDVAIMNGYSPEDLPSGNYMFFSAVPAIKGVQDTGLVENEYLYDWDDQHPVLRHVVLNYLRVSKWRRIELPEQAVTLVEGETTPVISILSAQGSRFIIVAFDVNHSNWPLRVSFPVFAYNAIRYLSSSVTYSPSQSVQPGMAASIPVPADAEALKIKRPDGRSDDVAVGDLRTVYYRDTLRLGVYRIAPSVEGYPAFAVNLLNATESNIRPNAGFSVGTEAIAAGTSIRRENRPLWPWLMLAAMAVLLVEWVIYNRRMRI